MAPNDERLVCEMEAVQRRDRIRWERLASVVRQFGRGGRVRP